MCFTSVNMEQINSARAIFKLLRKLKVCGTIVTTVQSNYTPYPATKQWNYSMSMVSYDPLLYKTPSEVAEDALECLFV